MLLELELRPGFKERLVHGTKSCHLGHLLNTRQVLWLGRVNQHDSKPEAEVDNRSHKRKVQEKTSNVVLFHISFAKVNHELGQLEEEGYEHEEEDGDGPSCIPMAQQLKEGEEVRGNIRSWHQ